MSGAVAIVDGNSIPVVAVVNRDGTDLAGGGGGGGGDASAANQVTGNNTLSTISGKLPASLGAKAGSASLSVTPATDAVTTVAPTGVVTAVDVTRPANQTPYNAGDVVGGVITFANMAAAAAAVVMLTGAALRCDIAAVPSGMANMRLYLYSATPPSALADNAAWDLPSGDRASFLGYIDLGTPVDLGSTLYTQASNANHQVKLGASTSLFGYLVTTGGFTPAANSEVYNLTLRALAGV